MRSRTILSAVLGAVVAGLVAVIMFLGGWAGPGANAGTTGPAPETTGPASTAPHSAPPPHSGGTVVRGGGSGGGSSSRNGTKAPPAKTKSTKTKPTKTKSTKTSPTKTKSTKTVPAKTLPKPPSLGTASVPPGATYDASSDGQAFTTVFSTLEAATGRALTKRLSTTIRITGDTRDAVLELGASGYAFTDASTTAQVTIAANGRSVQRGFRNDWDDEFVQTLSVPLRGAHECTVTLTVEVDPDPGADGYIDVLALDGQFI